MDDLRMVAISDEQAQILEDVGVEMMRLDDDRAMKVLALSLAWKFAKPTEPKRASNVLYMDAYSKRVPCA